MKGRLAVWVTVVAGFLASCTGVAPVPVGSTAQAFSADHFDAVLLSRAIFEETNRIRAIHGVPALAHLSKLDEAADEQAFYMALMFRSEHGNLIAGEANAGERAHHAGITWTRYAENVLMAPEPPPQAADGSAATYASLAGFLVDCWMGSPPHRANLLDPSLTGMGSSARFAHSVFGYPTVFASQVFIIRP
jgi:uncharacterized protein YkwD